MKIKLMFLIGFITVVFISCNTPKKSTTSGLPAIGEFQLKIKPFLAEVDNLGRLYVVDNKNRLINFKPDLTEQYRYADKNKGFISRVDVSNPLKIVVFSDDFNRVVLLDNTLSTITELHLGEKFSDVTACTVSNDGNLWIYDPTQFKLIKIKDNGSVILESSNVNDYGMDGVQIYDIREKNNTVVLCDKNKGFYIFDNLGQYQFHFDARDIKHFTFDGRNIYYYTSTGMKSFSIKFKERILISTPFEVGKPAMKYVIYASGDYYEVNENGINIFKSDKM